MNSGLPGIKNNRSDPLWYGGRVARLRLAPDGANEANHI
jgi:hypothetical protein